MRLNLAQQAGIINKTQLALTSIIKTRFPNLTTVENIILVQQLTNAALNVLIEELDND